MNEFIQQKLAKTTKEDNFIKMPMFAKKIKS